MAEPTLQDVFGSNAAQSASDLTISKTDLATIGLTPSASNSGESLLVAVILYAAIRLTETARSADQVNRNVTVFFGGQDISGSPPNVFRRDAFSLLLYRATTIAPVDPDDY